MFVPSFLIMELYDSQCSGVCKNNLGREENIGQGLVEKPWWKCSYRRKKRGAQRLTRAGSTTRKSDSFSNHHTGRQIFRKFLEWISAHVKISKQVEERPGMKVKHRWICWYYICVSCGVGVLKMIKLLRSNTGKDERVDQAKSNAKNCCLFMRVKYNNNKDRKKASKFEIKNP